MISIVIPLYNKELSIKRTLDSVLRQEEVDFEVVIVDDGSTDTSYAIAEEYAHKDTRIRLYQQENGGPSKARNTGARNAKGDWILFLDADDELLPGALKRFYYLTYNHPEATLISCMRENEMSSKAVRSGLVTSGILRNPYASLFFGYYGTSAGRFIIRKETALSCPFDESLRRYEDADFLFRVYRHASVYIDVHPVLRVNTQFASASQARNDASEDFVGHLSYAGKSFWEKLTITALYLNERDWYKGQLKRWPSLTFVGYYLLVKLFSRANHITFIHKYIFNRMIIPYKTPNKK